jgi:cell division protease FtsH
MPVDAWLPIGYKLPDGASSRGAIVEGSGWQIVETAAPGRALVAEEALATRWLAAGLLDSELARAFQFGSRTLRLISSGPEHMLCPVFDSRSPNTTSEALAFAQALRATRSIDADSSFHDAIYVERFSRLLPTYSISAAATDDVVLGCWLTGGAKVSVKSSRRVQQMLSWMNVAQLSEVLRTAGLDTELKGDSPSPSRPRPNNAREAGDPASTSPLTETAFTLPGRPELEAFFNEHILDIVTNRQRYKALGIGFPSALVLHGPPGCGKTYAIERLIDHLGWPSVQVDASSIASPYIHDTSRKIAQVFDKAIASAPSVLVIDEMDAFLADREMGSGHHRVEEVAEFLRRIPEAVKNDVLVIAMTNRLELIDEAILRRGRFDHLIKVDFPNLEEVRMLLDKLLTDLPKTNDVDSAPLAKALAGRALSDVAFVVREGARLAGRLGQARVNQECLLAALAGTPSRRSNDEPRRVGF